MSLNLYDILKEILNEEVTPYDVSSAIDNKQKVLITYDDEQYHKVGSRIVEPYVLGRNKAGNTIVRIFQGTGDTYRGIPHWKTIRLDRIKSWEATDDHFYQPPRKRGWNVEEYREDGDDSFSEIFTQAHFDDMGEKDTFSPNDTLHKLRNDVKQVKDSKPINISATTFSKDYGPVTEPKKTSDTGKTDFQKMLDRNLAITQKEKARNGKDMLGRPLTANTNDSGSTEVTRGPISEPEFNASQSQSKPQKDNDYWTDYDKAQAEMNYQNNPRLYRKSGEMRTDKRELERERRRQNVAAADERNLWRKGALNNK